MYALFFIIIKYIHIQTLKGKNDLFVITIQLWQAFLTTEKLINLFYKYFNNNKYNFHLRFNSNYDWSRSVISYFFHKITFSWINFWIWMKLIFSQLLVIELLYYINWLVISISSPDRRSCLWNTFFTFLMTNQIIDNNSKSNISRAVLSKFIRNIYDNIDIVNWNSW